MLLETIKRIRNTILNNTLLELTGPKKARSLYLTFDDGPTPGVTEKLLDILDEHNAKATFFVIGSKVHKYPEILQKVYEKGHSIGNHSYNHSNFPKISLRRRYSQINSTNQLIRRQLGYTPCLFRVPRGRWTLPILLQVKWQNMRSIHWSIDSMDYEYDNADKIVNGIMDKGLKAGDILLFHDDSSLCLQVVGKLLPLLAENNFSLIAMDDAQ